MTALAFLTVLSLTQSAYAVVDGRDASSGRTKGDRLVRQSTVKWTFDVPGGGPTTCTGVQIDPNTVLTAGHCLGEGDAAIKAMQRGRSFIEAYDETAPNKKRTYQVDHVESIFGPKADFAVLRVRGDLPAKQSLPLAYNGCDKGSDFVQAGFGLDARNEASKKLNVSFYRKAAPQDLSYYRKVLEPDSRRDYLSPLGRARTCLGDSGGPIYCLKHGRLAIYGIVNAIIGTEEKQTLKPGFAQSSRYCRDFTKDLSITRVSDGMREIENVRSAAPVASAKPAEGTSNTSAVSK